MNVENTLIKSTHSTGYGVIRIANGEIQSRRHRYPISRYNSYRVAFSCRRREAKSYHAVTKTRRQWSEYFRLFYQCLASSYRLRDILEVLAQLLDYDINESDPDLAERETSPSLALLAVLPNKDSPAFKEIADSLPGVDLRFAVIRDSFEPPSSYIIRSVYTGSRTIVNYNEIGEMNFDEFCLSFEALDHHYHHRKLWCHFEGRIPETTIECIKYVRRNANVLISVEVEKPNREGLQELAKEANVVFFSKSWATSQGYTSAKECLTSQANLLPRTSHLFCTWGADGAVGCDCARNEYVSLPAWRPEKTNVVDTVGAGDTFIAGILYGLLQHDTDWSLRRILDFAIRLSGIKVTSEGLGGLGKLSSILTP